MKAKELREKFLDYFKKKGHAVIPSASLVPENDPTSLFTSAGMQPLVPYLMGEKHPEGTRLTNLQRCVRTGDIDEVGNKSHLTFFEMMGYWSLGDPASADGVGSDGYWKKEAIEYIFEFLTKELGINPANFAVTCFEGDSENDIPKDEESYKIWRELGIPEEKIVYLGYEDNWWGPAGETGPCGPDTELFVWTGEGDVPAKFDPKDKGWMELCNDVFMEHNKTKRTILVDGMHCLYDENFKINKDLLIALNKIDAKKILVVNGYREKARETISAPNFDFFSLEEEGIKKDDPEFFKTLMKKYNLDVDDLIYFDHVEESVKNAENLGIVSSHYKNNGIVNFIKQNINYYSSLAQKNVDFGMGFERLLAYLEGESDIYKTDLFEPIIKKVEEISGKRYEGNEEVFRIIVDHVKTSVMIIDGGIIPMNTKQGYVLRRLIRRAIVKGKQLGIENDFIVLIAEEVLAIYDRIYQDIVCPEAKGEKTEKKILDQRQNFYKEKIFGEIKKEEKKFRTNLSEGLKLIQSKKQLDAKNLFDLYQSFGVPIEVSTEEAARNGYPVDKSTIKEYEKLLLDHQNLSRTASAGMFKGGLADAGEETKKLHTTAHLMLEALRKVLGDHVEQRGSNITAERLRFDFSHPEKMTDEEKAEVEKVVNEQIKKDLPVTVEEMTVGEAEKSGATGAFKDKYGEKVKVYSVGSFSKEICGGPHVEKTGELGHFKIKKEQSSSAGVRRIKAILE